MPNSGNNSFINKYLILPIEQYEQHIIENVDYKKFPLKNENTISKYNGNKGYEKAESTNQVSSTNEVTALLNASKQSDTNKSINGLTPNSAIENI